MNHQQTPLALIILDGFGHRIESPGNAIALAHTPFLRFVQQQYPLTYLEASGEAVGIPSTALGNSEVGHLTIGAGRVVEQPITILQHLINSHELGELPVWQQLLSPLSCHQQVHLIGLCSTAGIHGHVDHLIAYIRIVAHYTKSPIVLHLILDGRDSAPQSASEYISYLMDAVHQYNVTIASISGRYYAMDRDNNWSRTERAIAAMCGKGPHSTSWQAAIHASYDAQISDEFFLPVVLDSNRAIREGDLLICANFRPDRMRQLASSLATLKPSAIITPISYGIAIDTITLIERTSITDTLKEVVSSYDKSIFTIAETEKYAHVTYFFAGYREEAFANEQRVLIPSHKEKTYIQDPGMSAQEITETICGLQQLYDLYVINYANADMVGHSGDLPATIKAVEILDNQLQRLYNYIVQQHRGIMLITADHGNAEVMIDPQTGVPYTAHTNNVVPFMAISEQLPNLPLPAKGLSDIAPYILRLMQLPVPNCMKTKSCCF